jgi:glycerophosphoryl diester phosphodiesterase
MNTLLPFRLVMLMSLLSFAACKLTERSPRSTPAGFDWQGHRGCRGLRPENSIPAFVHALEYPQVVTLELDLAVSKDRQLIVSHEPWFNEAICRPPSGDSITKANAEKYLIYQMTAAEIKGWNCGSWGNPRFAQQKKLPVHKPTLREVVNAVKAAAPAQRTIRWNIEIKSQPDYDGVRTPPIEEFVALVLAEVRALGIEQQCCIQSFDKRPLQIIHREAPDMTLAYLIDNARSVSYNLEQLGFTPQIYSPYYLTVTKKMVRGCHRSDMRIIPWTVNDVSAMRRLIGLGVDGIITDYPNLIAEVSSSK